VIAEASVIASTSVVYCARHPLQPGCARSMHQSYLTDATAN